LNGCVWGVLDDLPPVSSESFDPCVIYAVSGENLLEVLLPEMLELGGRKSPDVCDDLYPVFKDQP